MRLKVEETEIEKLYLPSTYLYLSFTASFFNIDFDEI